MKTETIKPDANVVEPDSAPARDVPPTDFVPVDLSPIDFTLPDSVRLALLTITAHVPSHGTAGQFGVAGIEPEQPTAKVKYTRDHELRYRGSGKARAVWSAPIASRYGDAALGSRLSGWVDLFKLQKKPMTEIDAERIAEPDGGSNLPPYKQPNELVEQPPTPTHMMPATLLYRAADTLVSGRAAGAAWRKTRGYDGAPASLPFSELAKAAMKHVQSVYPSAPPISHRELVQIEARLANIDRCIRAAGEERAQLKAKLGWILVDSQTDPPSRPVNVGVTRDEQREMKLKVKGIDTRVRYAITRPTSDAPTPSDPSPILFLHGHSSRIEETDDVRAGLAKLGRPSIAFDLPGCGYSKQHDPSEVEDVESLGEKGCVPFFDHVVAAFAQKMLEEWQVPQLAAVCGGSLGGNLVMRQALLAASLPLRPFKHHIAWSPGCLMGVPGILRVAGGVLLGARIDLAESYNARREFFHLTFMSDVGKVRQANEWYRDDWEFKKEYIDLAWLDRHEIYSTKYRRWHWQLAKEQVTSLNILGRVHDGATFRALVLMAGERDDGEQSQIYTTTKAAADKLSDGKAFFWTECGHSIHNEYPSRLARVIDDILND